MPYTFFRGQVQAGNVTEVDSKGDTIQRTFRKPIGYPRSRKGTEAKRFETVRPAFADDSLLGLMLAKGVTINARSVDEGRPVWETLLVGFGPTLLLVGLFVLLARRAGSAAGGSRASVAHARSATNALTADDLRGRRRDRRGQGSC